LSRESTKSTNREFIYSGGTCGRAALIRGNMKYYRYRTTTLEEVYRCNNLSQLPYIEELYNLTADPFEYNNIISEHKDLAETFRHELEGIENESLSIDVKSLELDEETIERLRSLGYLT
jgi:hypothetical protein